MKPEQIPAELILMLDQAAGRQHTRTGSVATTLAAILTRYEELRTGGTMAERKHSRTITDEGLGFTLADLRWLVAETGDWDHSAPVVVAQIPDEDSITDPTIVIWVDAYDGEEGR